MRRRSAGQTLLIVLLTMLVVLTIVLSVISRSITDIAVSNKEEESLRAFLAAEAGIEKALLTGTFTGGSLGEASFSGSIIDIGKGLSQYLYPQDLRSGEVSTLWFVAHNEDGNLVCDPAAGLGCFTGSQLKLCWGKSDLIGKPMSGTTPAVEVSIFYLNSPPSYQSARIARAAFDPNSSRVLVNNFSSPDAGTCSLEGKQLAFQKTISLGTLGIPSSVYNSQNGLQFARVRMFYTDTSQPIGIDVSATGNTLPSQGKKIESTGVAGITAESTRKLEVFQFYPDLPPIFDAALYSSGDIVK